MLQNPAYRLVYPDILDSLLCHWRKRLFVCLVFPLTGLTSCATGRVSQPESERPEVPTPVSKTAEHRLNHNWQFSFEHRLHTYLSTAYATIQTADSTQSELDTLTSVIRFVIDTDRSDMSAVVSGIIDRVDFTTGSRIGISSTKPQVPISFEGSLSPKSIELNLTTSTDTQPTVTTPNCTNPNATVLGDIRTWLTILPQEITPGFKWADTVSTTTCSNPGISSALHVVRSYTVLGDTTYTGIEALVIRRTDTTKLDGVGAQGQHELTLIGKGTGLTTIYVDKRGETLAVNSLQDLSLTVTASGRLRHFNQRVQQTIKLLD